MQPRLLFVGPEQPIITLVSASFEGTEVVASVCADGTITVWDAHDGYSHGTAPQLAADSRPRFAVVLPDARHLLVAGDSPVVQIIDLWSLQVRFLVGFLL